MAERGKRDACGRRLLPRRHHVRNDCGAIASSNRSLGAGNLRSVFRVAGRDQFASAWDSEAITNLLLSCLDENPDLRPQNAEEVCRTLKALSSGSHWRREGGAQRRGQGRLAESVEGATRTLTQYSQIWEPVVEAEDGSQRRRRPGARFLVPALAAAAALALILAKGRAFFGPAPATVSIVAVQPAPAKKPEPQAPVLAASPAELPAVRESPSTVVAAPGFPEDALKALRDGVSKKVVLNHGALDLPSPGDWFLFWSDRTMSKSAHLPAAFLAHMTDREQLKTIVRPEFAVDGSWLILTSGGTTVQERWFSGGCLLGSGGPRFVIPEPVRNDF